MAVPERNLSPDAQAWGRWVEKHISELSKRVGLAQTTARTASMRTAGTVRALADVAAKTEQVEQGATDILQEVANKDESDWTAKEPENPSHNFHWYDAGDGNVLKIWVDYGDVERVNYVTNPSFRFGTDGWNSPTGGLSMNDGKAVLTATEGGVAVLEEAQGRAVTVDVPATPNDDEGEGGSPASEVGAIWTASAQVELVESSMMVTATIEVVGPDDVTVATSGPVDLQYGAPQRITAHPVDGIEATTEQVRVRLTFVNSEEPNFEVTVDEVMLEAADYGDDEVQPYFDGSMPGILWQGGDSTSTSWWDGVPRWVEAQDLKALQETLDQIEAVQDDLAEAADLLAAAQDWIDGTGSELQTRLGNAEAGLSEAEGRIVDAENVLEQAFPSGAFDVEDRFASTIQDTEVQYAVSSSETTPPTSGWSSNTPTRTPGTYVWFRTILTYASGDQATSSPALLTGNDGAPGSPGTPGAPGTDGVGVTSTVVTYAQSTSGTSAPTTGWQTTPPAAAPGRYIWTRTRWNYSDGTFTVADAVGRIGENGAPGQKGDPGTDGVGVTDTAVTYAQSTSGTSAPTSGWQATPPAAAAGRFVWTRTVWSYSDGTTKTAYAVGKIGEAGQKGDPGAPGQKGDPGAPGQPGADGDDGVGITSVMPLYHQRPASDPAPPQPSGANPSGWSTTEPAYDEDAALYRVERITYTNGVIVYTPVNKIASYEGIKDAREAARQAQTDADAAQGAAEAAQGEAEAAALNAILARESSENLITDSSFEHGGIDWELGADTTIIADPGARTGGHVLRAAAMSATRWPRQGYVPAAFGDTFYLEFWIKRLAPATGDVTVRAQVQRSSTTSADAISVNTVSGESLPLDEWVKVSGLYTVTQSDAKGVRLYPYLTTDLSVEYHIDDVRLIEASAVHLAVSSKATVLYQDTAPDPASNVLWFDTSDGNKPKTWTDSLGPEPRENLHKRDLDVSLGFNPGSGGNSANLIATSSVFRSAVVEVQPGEVYSLRKSGPTNRLRWVFLDVPPAAGAPNFGGRGGASSGDTDMAAEGIEVPDGASYMLIYYSQVATEESILIEKAPTAGPYFDGDTLGARWTGERRKSSSVYDGPGWVEVQDAGVQQALADAYAAQQKADKAEQDAQDAHTAAGDASTAASNALSAATHNGRNLFSTSAPSGTAPYGTIWMQRDPASNNRIIGQWQQVGGSAPAADGTGGAMGSNWQKRDITSEVISNLDVGKLTADSGSIGELVAEVFAAETSHLIEAEIGNLRVTGDAEMNSAVITELWNQVIRSRKITTDMLIVGGSNLLPDPNFEDSDLLEARRFRASALLNADRSLTTSSYFYYLPGTTAEDVKRYAIPVQPGETYRIEIPVSLSSLVSTTARVELFNSSGTGRTLQTATYADVTYGNGVLAYDYTIPAGYAYMAPVIYRTTSFTVYPGATVRQKVESSLIVKGGVTAEHLNVTTTDANGRGLRMDGNGITVTDPNGSTLLIKHDGLTMVNRTGQQVLTTDSNGNLIIGGDFTATGGTITGAKFRTGTTGRRVEIDPLQGIRVYNNAGQATMQADVSGNIELLSAGSGTSSKVSGRGLEVLDANGEPITRLGNFDRNELALLRGGNTVAIVSDDGSISGQTLTAEDEFYYQGDKLSDIIERNNNMSGPRGFLGDRIFAWGRGPWYQETGVGYIGWLVEPGRVYRITAGGHVRDNSGTGVHVRLRASWTANESVGWPTPNIATNYEVGGDGDAGAPSDGGYRAVSATSRPGTWVSFEKSWIWRHPNETLPDLKPTRWLLTLAPLGSTGSVQWLSGGYLRLEDLGADSATNNGWHMGGSNGGSGGDSSTPPADPTPPQKRTYVHTFSTSWLKSWQGNGQSPDAIANKAYQGYTPYYTTGGVYRSMAGVQNMTSVLNGAEVTKVEVRIRNGYNYPTTFVVGHHGYSSAPTSFGSNRTDNVARVTVPAGSSRWVELDSNTVRTGVRTGTVRGASFYINSTASGYYGYATAADFRVTYRR